jgi:hypothetical protein
MAKHSVDMVIKARDEASRNLIKVGGAAMSMGGMLKRAAAVAATYFSARAIINFSKSSLEEYGKQEDALIGLGQALENLDQRFMLPIMENFANEMQKTTKYGDDEVLMLMQLLTTLGVMPARLREATTMSIGLAAAINSDAQTTAKYIALAMQGEYTMLRRYIPALRKTTDETEQFKIIQETATNGFKIAQAQAKTYNGTIVQMRNIYGDLKEEIGKALMPVFKSSAERIKIWIEENKQGIGNWAQKTVNFVILVKDVFADFIDFMKTDFTGGLKWAFDSFLKIMRAAFESAVLAAFAGGQAIWQGVQKGLMGKGDVNKSALEKYTAGGGTITTASMIENQMRQKGIQVWPFDNGQRQKYIDENYVRIQSGGPGSRDVYIDKRNAELYEKARQEALKQYNVSNTKDLMRGLWTGVTESFGRAFEDIISTMPPGLKEEVQKSYKAYLARLQQISLDNFPYIPGSGIAGGKDDGRIKGERRGVAIIQRGGLTMGPGARIDPVVETAKKGNEILKKIEKNIFNLTKMQRQYLKTFNLPQSANV